MDNREWPNLFVVGAGRAGTTSLWSYLRQHPQIFMSKLKEPHFFTRETPQQQRVVHDESEYKALFRPGRELPFRGEASPSYLWHPAAPGAIARVQPESRIVISLRDPIARAFSAYRLRRRNGLDRQPFLDALRAGLSLPDSELPQYFYAGRYLGPVTTYLRMFPDRVHVLVFEELAEDTPREVDRIFEFLGVEPVAAELDLTPLKRGAAPRNALARSLYSTRLRSAARAVVPPQFHARIENAALSRDYPGELEPEARRILAEFFAPEREPLERLLGRSLPWPRG
ncbi:MAG: sulfotransferase [Actinomycetota bacterium]|nr:sulfotransferase [Actinomycetota bacterium]